MTAPRPRVSEHTDAARLEALRDSMRPRVEGEAVTPEEVRWLAQSTVIMNGINVSAVAADWLALTAEVARLTKEKAEIISMAWELERVAGSMSYDGVLVASIRSRLAALALPTNAPEAKG